MSSYARAVPYFAPFWQEEVLTGSLLTSDVLPLTEAPTIPRVR